MCVHTCTHTHTFFCLKLPATLWFTWGTDGDPAWIFKCFNSLFASFSHSYITVTFFFTFRVFIVRSYMNTADPESHGAQGPCSLASCLVLWMFSFAKAARQTRHYSCCSVSISFSLGIRENNAKDKAWASYLMDRALDSCPWTFCSGLGCTEFSEA